VRCGQWSTLALVVAVTACGNRPAPPDAPPAEGPWRSALYPEGWTPAFTDPSGAFLHDVSYAGYHRSERALPTAWPGGVEDVTMHGAVADGVTDSAGAFAAAIAAVKADGGGVVFVPDGEYLLASNLLIDGSNILLRGASRTATRLRFSATATSGVASITFAGAAPPPAGQVALIADAEPRSHVIRVADPSGFQVGDDVLVDQEITQAFIDEHGMAGLWDTGANSALGLRKVFLQREIVAIAGDAITLDVPVRSRLRVRDGAAVRRDAGTLRDCGVESISVNSVVDPAAAGANPRAHAIELSRVRDCFVRDVASYASPLAPVATAHLQSGGVYVVGSKRVTVADTVMAHAQNHGSGGAGYGFEASASNEVLFRDDRTEHVRHGLIQNWDFGASGLVWLRCDSLDNTLDGVVAIAGRSEYHHRLATANLFDSTRDTAGFNALNRGAESSHAGHTATENVFWNVAGRDARSHLVSFQAGLGYVIGTRDLTVHVEPDELAQLLGQAEHTAPTDWVEGIDRGPTLSPTSLFEDQLERRLR